MTSLRDRPNTALLVVDVQNDVVAKAYHRDEVIANISTLIDRARAQRVSVIWVQHADIFPRGSSLMSIGFSFLVAGIAAMNLALDFDFIEKAEAAGAPKYMEWYAAFGLLVTLVWLYLEILRLLSKLRDR